jgi:hypothetical protein
MRKTFAERFFEKVNKTDACWLWTATRHHRWGYGHIRADGKNKAAHRVSWELHFGPIPDGLLVCHKCDNPLCVNPAHLFLGTNADNAADRVAKGRSVYPNAFKTHCPKGHEYTPDNTRIYKSKQGWTMRFCISCDRDFCSQNYRKNRTERIRQATEYAKKRREADPEGFKAKQREYTRAYRARKKALASQGQVP